jgi:hypothetical protein
MEVAMKIKQIPVLFIVLILVGCVAIPYDQYQAAPYYPPQGAPYPPSNCRPYFYPVWNGCAYGGSQHYTGFSPMYGYPILFPQAWFGLNFGGGGKHHRGGHGGHNRGGGHHRGR